MASEDEAGGSPPTKKVAKKKQPPKKKARPPRPGPKSVTSKRGMQLPDPPDLPIDPPPRVGRESDHAYAAFLIWLSTPLRDRVVRQLARDLELHVSQITRWSKAYDWRGRTAAYDELAERELSRVWHISRDPENIQRLSLERSAELEARRLLVKEVIPALKDIVKNSRSALARVGAARELMKIAGHEPDRPVEPLPIGDEQSTLGIAQVAKWLREKGVARETLLEVSRVLDRRRREGEGNEDE